MEKAKAEENGDKYVSGIKSKEGAAKQAGEDISKTTVDALGSADSYSAGMEIISKIENGVRDAAGSLFSAAWEVANSLQTIFSNTSIAVETSASSGSYPKTATGGIVTRAQTRLVGEDGAEAIVPLENNTEWIDKVAAKVTDSMGGAPSNTAILNKLNELIEVIKGQKVYLDSGALVGEIAPAMDGALGNISRMKRRGLR